LSKCTIVEAMANLPDIIKDGYSRRRLPMLVVAAIALTAASAAMAFHSADAA
jgi:hypothetical protein